MVERLELRRDGRRLLTYGTSQGADLMLHGMRYEGHRFLIDAELGRRVRGGERVLRGWTIPLPGEHNALNALAAIAVASEAGISDEAIHKSLANFTGVKRRYELAGMWNGAAIYDDYAHHPAEISAVLGAARGGSSGRLIAVFEPHRYTRVRDLFDDFCASFRDADSVIVAPLYTAGEQPIDGIDQHTMAEGIRRTGHPAVIAIDNPRDLIPLLRRSVRPGDSVVCLGAGVSTEWAHGLPDWLDTEEPRRAGGAL
jgi:UDP-N-acetylmuramate--alanine ligase